ncbi:7127_t:CDS:2 [Dentiscutata erythropus]|uniref:7127_t:CDS:1 n=1 Tax=Dentiscutata erythropus TaxID=1348616 RepID=A0A9N9F3B7_9GLOM|nr:7127_t:CDS:2 [Dentiscutata erythropus]
MPDYEPIEPHKNKRTFEFIKQNEMLDYSNQLQISIAKVERITRNNKYEITYQKNLIANLKVSTNLTFSLLSTDLEGGPKYEEASSMTFDVNLQSRAKVIMANKIRSKNFKKQ